MNAALVMETCPSEELLAAFIDGRLDEQSRKQIIAHLADCAECRDVVVTANEYGSSAEAATAPGSEVVLGRFGRSRWLAPLIAAAAVVTVVFGVPAIRERVLPKSGMDQLVAAANTLPERPAHGRLSANFPYKEKKTPRSASVNHNILESPELYAAALDIAEEVEDNATPRNLHADGVANLFLNQRDHAIESLQRAATANPSSAQIQNDLAVAYLARGRAGDDELALTSATKALAIERTPAAAWNIALALQRLQRDRDAIAAWNEYLELDPNSEWANEVREKHLPLLTMP